MDSGINDSSDRMTDNTFSDKNDFLRILYTNARSLIGKIDLLKTYVYELKPSLVCVSEACTNSSISDA